jgi:hypothetical protein
MGAGFIFWSDPMAKKKAVRKKAAAKPAVQKKAAPEPAVAAQAVDAPTAVVAPPVAVVPAGLTRSRGRTSRRYGN